RCGLPCRCCADSTHSSIVLLYSVPASLYSLMKKGRMTMSLSIARCGDLKLDLGECPVWEEANQKLWLMDCRQGRIYSMDRDWNASLEAKIEPPTGSFALCADGSLIVSRKETIVRRREGKEEILAQIEESHPNMRLNDGAV